MPTPISGIRSTLPPRLRTLLAAATLLFAIAAPAQTPTQTPSQSPAKDKTIPALFLSDIHFDPFHDPSKATQLAAAPIADWNTILSAPDSPDQSQAFAHLQQTCGSRGADTPYVLLQSSLQAIRANAADARFTTLSGDLLAHAFHCRYTATIPTGTPDSYNQFLAKTIHYLVTQLQSALPGRPLYLALGNNDTNCGDYQLDPGGSFLALTRDSIAAALPPNPSRRRALADFTAMGNYSITLPAPLHRTRLIVLDDIFLSRRYSSCASQPNPAAITQQLTWLRMQLAQARRHHQTVWVLGHIPPGVDFYATFRKMLNLCSGAQPVTFLSSDQLPDTLVDSADIVRLAIFGHTHMDELRLFAPEPGQSHSPHAGPVPIKMVSSISPVNGNLPTFTMARIDPATATLADYQVISASNLTGVQALWSSQYTFTEAHHQPTFSPAPLAELLHLFSTDPEANTDSSQAYIRHYFPGDRSALIKPLWPQYTCSLAHYTAQAFTACACAQSSPTSSTAAGK